MIKLKVRRFLVGLAWLALWVSTAQAQSEKENTLKGEDLGHSLANCLGSVECRELVLERSFFPRGTFSSELDDGAFTHLWYSEHLAAMEEPAFAENKEQGFEAYRFLWLRTFDRPVALRIQNEGRAKTLVVKQLSGSGGYGPGILDVDKKIKIGAQEWDAFVRLLDEANYWNLATNKLVMGADGAQWILEGLKSGRYHIVDRWSPSPEFSPEEDMKFRDACLFLLELSGLEIQKVY